MRGEVKFGASAPIESILSSIGELKVKLPRLDPNPPEAWRWWVYIILFFLFPIVFHPWWLAIICLAIYSLLLILLLQKKPNSK